MGYSKQHYSRQKWQHQEGAYPMMGLPYPVDGMHFVQQPPHAAPFFVPLWIPAYPMPACYPLPQHVQWMPSSHGQAHNRGEFETDLVKGTGVFLPNAAPEKESTSISMRMPKQIKCPARSETDTDSDLDSAESSSDCIQVGVTPFKRGQLDRSIPIEQLLPEEWEY